MDRRIAQATKAALLATLAGLLLSRPAIADDPGPPPSCSPNGSACKFGSMCIGGTCTFCSGAACGAACQGLRGQEQVACSRAVIRAQIAASEREQVVSKEKAEAAKILDALNRQLDPSFVLRLSDAGDAIPIGAPPEYAAQIARQQTQSRLEGAGMNLSNAVAIVQAQVDRIDAISADLGLPADPHYSSSQVAGMADLVATEKACRASPKCLADRALKATIAALCNADYWLDDNKRVIREERANAAGVVDLSVLHDAGDAIRIHTAQIAALKPALHRGWRGWRVECPDSHGVFQPAPEDLRPAGSP
jgi:hypothetical protein